LKEENAQYKLLVTVSFSAVFISAFYAARLFCEQGKDFFSLYSYHDDIVAH
jgi:hypothetical protein